MIEITDEYCNGLLSSVRDAGENFVWEPSEDFFYRDLVGPFIEDVIVAWVKDHRHDIVGEVIDADMDKDYKLRMGRPKGRTHRAWLGSGYVYKDIRSDYLFLVDHPDVGRVMIMIEAKFGHSGIQHSQAQFYRDVYHRPESIISDADEGHVFLVKCYHFELLPPKFEMYSGELIVPDYDPMENEEMYERWQENLK